MTTRPVLTPSPDHPIREARLAELDAAIARGLADADAGRTRPATEVLDRLRRKYAAGPKE